MDFQEQMSRELFTLAGVTVNLGQVMEIAAIIGFILLIGYLLLVHLLPRFYGREDISAELRPRARRVIFSSIVLLSVITILRILNIDFLLFPFDESRIDDFKVNIRISNLVTALLLLLVANLIDWLFDEILIQWTHRKAQASDEPVQLRGHFRMVEPAVYTIVAIMVSKDIGLNQVSTSFGSGKEPTIISIGGFLFGLLAFFLIRLILQIIQEIGLSRYYRKAQIDSGSRQALNQLLTYFAYVIGILIMLETAGFSLIALWTGAAALLVGIGIGLQQTFNDLICGIIILFERSVKVGDVVEMSGSQRTGTVRKIGARTSHVETRDGILVYVPNSKLIGDSVVNWSQTERKARFHVGVGVAYGSDTDLVKKILLDAAAQHPRIMKLPAPFVRFMDFGSSSLDFEIIFWSRDFLRIEDIKSDLRFAIDKSFREKNVEIPFPQRDLWIRGGEAVSRLGRGEKGEEPA